MIIELTAAATAGGIVGFFACAMMTMSKVADADQSWRDENDFANLNREKKDEALLAHARATDRGNTLQARIDRALAVETPKAAHGVRKMAAILRGDA